MSTKCSARGTGSCTGCSVARAGSFAQVTLPILLLQLGPQPLQLRRLQHFSESGCMAGIAHAPLQMTQPTQPTEASSCSGAVVHATAIAVVIVILMSVDKRSVVQVMVVSLMNTAVILMTTPIRSRSCSCAAVTVCLIAAVLGHATS